MTIKEIKDYINKGLSIDYSKKVMLIRELFKLAIEFLKEKNINIGEENPFKLLEIFKDDDLAKEILNLKEKLNQRPGGLLDS